MIAQLTHLLVYWFPCSGVGTQFRRSSVVSSKWQVMLERQISGSMTSSLSRGGLSTPTPL